MARQWLFAISKGSLGIVAGVCASGLKKSAQCDTVGYPAGSECYPDLEYGHWEKNWDGMAAHPQASDDLKARLAKGPARHFYLIRHGQYDLDFKGDPPLTDLGREQAHIVGRRIKEWSVKLLKDSPHVQPKHVNISEVITSTINRAEQTGDIIAEELGLKVKERDPLLNEGAPCPPVPSVGNWSPFPSTVFQDSVRIEAAFRKYFHRSIDGYEAHVNEMSLQKANKPLPTYEGPPQHIILACHGNVIRYFVMRALQLPPSAWLRTATYNTGITHIVISPSGNVSVRSFGDHGHLPLDQVTYH